jgi:preprotein translocase subunit YajC
VQGNPIGTFLPLILLVVVFYFLLIRPQRRRAQEQTRMQSNLAPGTRIMTTTGLFAEVIAVEDDDVVLEIAPGVQTRWVKAAIGRVLTPVDDDPVDDEEPESDTVTDTEPDPVTDETRDATEHKSGDGEDSTTKKS